MKLKVEQARRDDVFEDVMRVNEKDRIDSNGRRIPTGAICSIEVHGCKVYAVSRGTAEEGIIAMDDALRERLGVNTGDVIEPRFRAVGVWGEQMWGWRASHPVTRAASRLGIISLTLGVIGLLLGILSVAPVVAPLVGLH